MHIPPVQNQCRTHRIMSGCHKPRDILMEVSPDGTPDGTSCVELPSCAAALCPFPSAYWLSPSLQRCRGVDRPYKGLRPTGRLLVLNLGSSAAVCVTSVCKCCPPIPAQALRFSAAEFHGLIRKKVQLLGHKVLRNTHCGLFHIPRCLLYTLQLWRDNKCITKMAWIVTMGITRLLLC